MDYAVSVVIPFFNAKKYLKTCIETLQQQSLQKIEIIFINDGSLDGGEKIVEEYIKKNGNICLINKANSGQGDSRNIGIDRAQGRYIYFLDVDDCIAHDCLEKVYAIAEKSDADIVTFDSVNIVDGVEKFLSYDSIPESYKLSGLYMKHALVPGKEYTGQEFTVKCLNSSYGFFPVVWLALYKRQLLVEHNIKFQPIIHEDNIFCMEISLKANRVIYLDEILHFRRIVPTSTTNQHKSDKHISGGLMALTEAIKVNRKMVNDKEQKLAFNKWCLCCAGLVYKEMKETDKFCRQKYKKKYIVLMLKNLKMFNLKLIIKALITL